jgi:hypothetical protein
LGYRAIAACIDISTKEPMKRLLFYFLFLVPYLVLPQDLVLTQEENKVNGEINTGQCGKVQIVDSLNQDALQSDKFAIQKVIIEDGCIKFRVVYGGGCGTTNFILITDNRITESMAPSMDVYLKLTDNDFCKALRYQEVSYNLNGFLPLATDLGLAIRIVNNDSVVILKR